MLAAHKGLGKRGLGLGLRVAIKDHLEAFRRHDQQRPLGRMSHGKLRFCCAHRPYSAGAGGAGGFSRSINLRIIAMQASARRPVSLVASRAATAASRAAIAASSAALVDLSMRSSDSPMRVVVRSMLAVVRMTMTHSAMTAMRVTPLATRSAM